MLAGLAQEQQQQQEKFNSEVGEGTREVERDEREKE
jgi:hypothetical protein